MSWFRVIASMIWFVLAIINWSQEKVVEGNTSLCVALLMCVWNEVATDRRES